MGGGGGRAPHVGSQLKFHHFVGCQLYFSPFVASRLIELSGVQFGLKSFA